MASNLRTDDPLDTTAPFADLLSRPGVAEFSDLRGRFGFMAFHGGHLERMTDEIAMAAADECDASLYCVVQPEHQQWHIASHRVSPDESPCLAEFLDHVDVVIAVHGYGRDGFWQSVLLGGSNRMLAERTAVQLIPRLPRYEFLAREDAIPRPLRGMHPENPVNRPKHGGVQIELPPRIRGLTPRLYGWNGRGRFPHVQHLIDGLADTAREWERHH